MSSASRTLPLWLLVSAAWTGPALVAGLREYVQGRLGGNEDALRAAAFEFGDWFLLALLTPLVFRLARRFPLDRAHLARRVLLHAAAALLFCWAWAVLGIAYGSLLHGELWTPYGMGPLSWLLATLPFGVAVYFSMLGVEHAVFYFLESRERETQAARLSAQLAEARMGALRMQLQPHFLLNSLNAITVIVRDRDVATATRMLEQLGDMLRRVMRRDRPAEGTLGEELDFMRQYLAIEAVRYGDRLTPVFDVDAALLGAAVPEFILQPLVENAVRHAVAKRTTDTRIEVAARREGDELVLSVTDNGPGMDAGAAEGVGLGNTRERLATQYGDRARLTIAPAPGGGTQVTIRLPWRAAGGGAG